MLRPTPWPTRLRTTPNPRASTADLHRVGDIAEAVPGAALVDRRLEALVAGVDQVARLLGRAADGEGDGRVGHVAVERHADVDREQVAVDQRVRAGDAVHHHGVRRCADRPGVPAVALERSARRRGSVMKSSAIRSSSRSATPGAALRLDAGRASLQRRGPARAIVSTSASDLRMITLRLPGCPGARRAPPATCSASSDASSVESPARVRGSSRSPPPPPRPTASG